MDPNVNEPTGRARRPAIRRCGTRDLDDADRRARGLVPGFMTVESGAASTTAPGAEILLVEEATLREPGAYRFSSLVSWLVATAKPEVTVELGPGDERSLASTCDAVVRSGPGRTCSAVVLGPRPGGDFTALAEGLTRRFGQNFEGYGSEEAGLAAAPAPAVSGSSTSPSSMQRTRRCPTWPPGARCWPRGPSCW